MPTNDTHATQPGERTDETPREQRPEGDQQEPDEVTGDVGRRPGGTVGAVAAESGGPAPRPGDTASGDDTQDG